MQVTDRVQELDTLEAKWGDCKNCPLHELRTEIIFGYGNTEATVVLIGDTPNLELEVSEITDKVLASVGIPRADVWETNICLCRPKPAGEFDRTRAPNKKEIEACRPRLQQELCIIKPKLVVLMGNVPLYMVVGKRGITKNRGWLIGPDSENVIYPRVYATLHPASLLRGSAEQVQQKKKWAWEDWKEIGRVYKEWTK